MLPPPLTRAEVRELDRIAIEEFGIPGAVLMENAGRNAAAHLLEAAGVPAAGLRIAILCGSGNNGGDGYVMARHLANAGCEVELHSTATREGLAGDAALNRGIVDRMGLVVHELLTAHQLTERSATWPGMDVLVDALLGTGFRGQVRPHMAQVIEAIDALGARDLLLARGGARIAGASGASRGGGAQRPRGPVICAVDVPSGLDCDTGQPSNATVRATYTLTLAAPKVGFSVPGADAWTGPVTCLDIGAPPEIARRLAGGA